MAEDRLGLAGVCPGLCFWGIFGRFQARETKARAGITEAPPDYIERKARGIRLKPNE